MVIDYTKYMPATQDTSMIVDDPTPYFNVSTSKNIRSKMAKVYRETNYNKIMTSNGSIPVNMMINPLSQGLTKMRE